MFATDAQFNLLQRSRTRYTNRTIHLFESLLFKFSLLAFPQELIDRQESGDGDSMPVAPVVEESEETIPPAPVVEESEESSSVAPVVEEMSPGP